MNEGMSYLLNEEDWKHKLSIDEGAPLGEEPVLDQTLADRVAEEAYNDGWKDGWNDAELFTKEREDPSYGF